METLPKAKLVFDPVKFQTTPVLRPMESLTLTSSLSDYHVMDLAEMAGNTPCTSCTHT